MLHAFKPTLLVVDDERDVLEVSSALLQYFGFGIVSTSDPLEALRHLQSNSEIDCVVTDFRMPTMNGDELAKSAKAMRPDIPVFILSGTYPPQHPAAPWDGWFLKGEPINDLIESLNSVTMKQSRFCLDELPQQQRNVS